MPNYPKYDPQRRTEIAQQLKNIINAARVDGDTENGRSISAWATEGNWLDKTIEYFQVTEEERKDPALRSLKNSIRQDLENLKKVHEKLELFSGGMVPENGEKEWDELMSAISGSTALSDRLLKYNEHTGYKNIGDPAVQAAFGTGSIMSKLGSRLELIGRNDLMEEFRKRPAEVNRMRQELVPVLDKLISDCKAANVDHTATEKYQKAAGDRIDRIRKRREEYEGLSKVLDMEASAEEKKQNAESTEILTTKMELAYQQYKFCGHMAAIKERELNTKELNLAMDRRGGTATPEMESEVEEDRRELERLQKINKDKKLEYNKLMDRFDKLDPDTKKLFNTEYSFDAKTANEKIGKLNGRLETLKEEYAQKNPESTKISESGKNLNEGLKQAIEQLKAKEQELDERFLHPVQDLRFDSIEISRKLTSINQHTNELKEKAQFFHNENPAAVARNSMKDFLAKLDNNKRRFHRDSPEFAALKDKVKRYSEKDKNVKLSDIRDAAKTYLDKIEGQRFSLNTTQRNYRKNLAKMIMDCAASAAERQEFLNRNGREIYGHIDKLGKINNEVNGKNFDFYAYNNPSPEEQTALEDSFNAALNQVTKDLNGPMKKLDGQIREHIEMTERANAPQVSEKNLQQQLTQPVAEAPIMEMH